MKKAVILTVIALLSLPLISCGTSYSEKTVSNVNSMLTELTAVFQKAAELEKGKDSAALSAKLNALQKQDATFSADKELGNEYKTAFGDEQFAKKSKAAYEAYNKMLKNEEVPADFKKAAAAENFQAMRWLNAVKDAKTMLGQLNNLCAQTAQAMQKAENVDGVVAALNNYTAKMETVHKDGVQLEKKYPKYRSLLAGSPLLKAQVDRARKVMVDLGKTVKKMQERYSDENKGKTVDNKVIKAEDIKKFKNAFKNLQDKLKQLKEKKV